MSDPMVREPVPADVAGATPARPTLVTPALLRGWRLPEPSGTKYSRGMALVVGGAAGTPGAAMLAGLAALRVGAGRLSLAVARGIAPHVAVAVPESGVVPLDEEAGSVTGIGAAEALEHEAARAHAILAGPGLDDNEGARRLVDGLAQVVPGGTPVLLDAFALGVLPETTQETRDALAGRLLLTPNRGELAHLLGRDEIDEEQLPRAVVSAARRLGATVSCSGWVVDEGAVWRITTGDTGLGTSGSGDVLAGTILGLLARGASLPQAAVWGTHLHAAAGDSLAARVGRVGYLAGELLPELPLQMVSLGGA